MLRVQLLVVGVQRGQLLSGRVQALKGGARCAVRTESTQQVKIQESYDDMAMISCSERDLIALVQGRDR